MPESKTHVPKGAKKPADRKVKAEVKAKDPLFVTAAGVKLAVDASVLDDFELLDDLAEADKGNSARMASMLRRLAGDQWHEIMEALRDKETGRVSLEDGAGAVKEILEQLDPN